MARHEFSRATKRAALRRAGDGDAGKARCEADNEVYGLEAGRRCYVPLSQGVEFDHWPLPATDKGSDGLDNCMSVCPQCHRFKTSSFDVPMQAKNKRQSDKALGIRSPSKWRKPGDFTPRPPKIIDHCEQDEAIP